MPQFALLPDRAVLRITGDDARSFLQGLVSNDVMAIAPDRAIWAAFLTPQGKYLFDFAIIDHDGALMLDVEAARAADLAKRLSMFKLRSKVSIEIDGSWSVAAGWGTGAAGALGLEDEAGTAVPAADGIAFVDPRLADAGVRIVAPGDSLAIALPPAGADLVGADAYDSHRLSLGLPDGSTDLTPEKATLMESGFDELHGIDWKKGCYMGQELTARMRYRGLVKKRLLPVVVDGDLPAPGTDILTDDGKSAGEVRSGRNGRALALLRLDKLDGALIVAGTRLRPDVPGWVRLPETSEQ